MGLQPSEVRRMTLPDFLLLAQDIAEARSPKRATTPPVPDADMIAALRRVPNA
jgi:hypothetical protein